MVDFEDDGANKFFRTSPAHTCSFCHVPAFFDQTSFLVCHFKFDKLYFDQITSPLTYTCYNSDAYRSRFLRIIIKEDKTFTHSLTSHQIHVHPQVYRRTHTSFWLSAPKYFVLSFQLCLPTPGEYVVSPCIPPDLKKKRYIRSISLHH